MSTLRVDALKSANGNSFILDVAQRNLIDNGDMTIAQRGTSNSGITSAGYYTVDRWETSIGGGGGVGTWTQSQSTDTPEGTANTNGRFMHSLKMECTTADATLSNTESLWIKQTIEAASTDRYLYGTTSAKKSTLSFWVKSNKTGTYNVVWYNLNSGRNRQCIGRYTIDVADTWEKKIITIDGDTEFDYNPRSDPGNPGGGRILRLYFVLASGPGRLNGTVSEGEWQGGDSLTWSHGHTVNLGDTIGNTWYITGVQLEVGENATEFQYHSLIDNFMQCSRYYQRISRDDTYASSPIYTQGVYLGWGQFFSGTQAIIQWPLVVPFKFTPTVTYSDATHINISNDANFNEPSTAIALYNDSLHAAERHARAPYLLFTTVSATNASIGRAYINNSAGWIALGSE